MPAPYCYDYPRPAVTADVVVFANGNEPDAFRLLLIRRKHDPFAGRWAFPGGFINIDEPLEAGARRELKEETGLELDAPLTLLGVYGDPDRDPRGRTISVVYLVNLFGPPPRILGGDDAAEAAWVDPTGLNPLAFDHDKILADALRTREEIRQTAGARNRTTQAGVTSD